VIEGCKYFPQGLHAGQLKQNLLYAVYVKTNYAVNLNINYRTNQINNVYYTKFLGLTLYNTLSWKPHIDRFISKLNSECYVIKSLKSIISLENHRIICFTSVHSITSYCIIFWGKSTYSNTIFILERRVIRIMMNAGIKESCHEMFKNETFFSYTHSI
jgi:hypothetical protein